MNSGSTWPPVGRNLYPVGTSPRGISTMGIKHRNRIYWPDCAVCQYMKKNPTFRQQVMESRYFDIQGTEDMMTVVHRWGDPFKPPTMYSHLRRHQSKPTREMEVVALPGTVPVEFMEPEVTSGAPHERALDEIISKGRNMVRSGEIKITAQSLNVAIKTKADIEKANKDRGLDAMKMFSGAFAGKTENDTNSTPGS